MRRRALYVRDERGEFGPAGAELILAAAKAYLRTKVRRGIPLTNPQVVRDFLTVHLSERDVEYFCLLLLDTRHRLLKFVELFRGTIDAASVHPREVVKTVIEAQAAAVVLVHNHPSQVTEPSAADQRITARLREALALIDVRVVDHLLGGRRCVTRRRIRTEISQRRCILGVSARIQSCGDTFALRWTKRGGVCRVL